MSKVVQSAIRSSHYGNCKYCRNKSTSYCEESEHYDPEYYDYWESIAPEEMADEKESFTVKMQSEYCYIPMISPLKSPPVKVGMTVPKDYRNGYTLPYCGISLGRTLPGYSGGVLALEELNGSTVGTGKCVYPLKRRHKPRVESLSHRGKPDRLVAGHAPGVRGNLSVVVFLG